MNNNNLNETNLSSTTSTLIESNNKEELTNNNNKKEKDSNSSVILTEKTLPNNSNVLIPYSIFTNKEKWAIVLLISTAGLFSPLSANIYFPAIPAISTDLNVTIQAVNLSVTFYMVLQGISPTLWGSICDVMGRRPVYLATFTVYILACIGLALTETYWLLVVLRCVQAFGSSSVIAVGSGSISDISTPKERGLYMATFSLGPMMGSSIGPIFGGVFAEYFGWQSIFWFLAALATTLFCIMLTFLPETLRTVVGNGSIPTSGINRSLLSLLKSRKHKDEIPIESMEPTLPRKTFKDVDLLGPFRLFGQKDVLLLLTFNSIIYTLFYCVVTSTAISLQTTYNLTELSIGLCFIANGTGCLLASIMNGPRMNRDFRIVAEQLEKERKAKREEEGGFDGLEMVISRDGNNLEGFPIEHARLRSLPYFFVVFIASTITYGWTLDKGVYIAVPLICQFFIGLTVTTQFNNISTLLVDLYPGKSASATAANNLYRCLMGAAGTAVIDPILSKLGPGWTFTMLSLITCCFVPLIAIEWKYGESFRAERVEKDKERLRQMSLREKE